MASASASSEMPFTYDVGDQGGLVASASAPVYGSGTMPRGAGGITRRGSGRGRASVGSPLQFAFIDASGSAVAPNAAAATITVLLIPPPNQLPGSRYFAELIPFLAAAKFNLVTIEAGNIDITTPLPMVQQCLVEAQRRWPMAQTLSLVGAGSSALACMKLGDQSALVASITALCPELPNADGMKYGAVIGRDIGAALGPPDSNKRGRGPPLHQQIAAVLPSFMVRAHVIPTLIIENRRSKIIAQVAADLLIEINQRMPLDINALSSVSVRDSVSVSIAEFLADPYVVCQGTPVD